MMLKRSGYLCLISKIGSGVMNVLFLLRSGVSFAQDQKVNSSITSLRNSWERH
jgi:hypothetical protein